jgi:FkbM family methyltransferase
MTELFERASYLWQYGQHLPWRETRRMERLLTEAVQQEQAAQQGRRTLASQGEDARGDRALETDAATKRAPNGAARVHDLYLKRAQRIISLREDSADALVFREIFFCDEYVFVDSFLQEPPRTMIDLGGNIGLAALWFSLRYPGIRLLVVEPDRGNYRLALANLRHEIGSGTCDVVEDAAWSSDGWVSLDRQSRTDWSLRCVPSQGGASRVRALSLPSLLERSGFEQIDLLKIDIEGGEQELLTHAVASWSDRVRTIVCERHNGLSHDWFCQQLDGCGYRCLEVSRQMSAAVRETVGGNFPRRRLQNGS